MDTRTKLITKPGYQCEAVPVDERGWFSRLLGLRYRGQINQHYRPGRIELTPFKIANFGHPVGMMVDRFEVDGHMFLKICAYEQRGSVSLCRARYWIENSSHHVESERDL